MNVDDKNRKAYPNKSNFVGLNDNDDIEQLNNFISQKVKNNIK